MPDKQDMIADTMIQYQNIESKLITSNVSETESLEQNTQEEDSLLDTLQVVNDVRRASKITNVMPDTFDSFVSFNSEEDIYEAGTSVYDTASEESSMFNFMHKFKSSKDVATTTICSDCQRNPEILMNRFTQETKNQEVRVASQLTNAKVLCEPHCNNEMNTIDEEGFEDFEDLGGEDLEDLEVDEIEDAVVDASDASTDAADDVSDGDSNADDEETKKLQNYNELEDENTKYATDINTRARKHTS